MQHIQRNAFLIYNAFLEPILVSQSLKSPLPYNNVIFSWLESLTYMVK